MKKYQNETGSDNMMASDLSIVGLTNQQLGLSDPVDEIKDWMNKINSIEKKYKTKLSWDGNTLNGNQLSNAIKSCVTPLESSCTVKTIYLQTINKQGKHVTLEHGYQVRGSSQKNNEYERLMAGMIKKEDALNTVDIFVNCFNRLDELFRIILYYSLFKKESALKISQMRLKGEQLYASRTVLRKRKSGFDHLAKMLRFASWQKSNSNDEYRHM